MKKALSVLLVAAAIFGFYGSAVTVKDLLACKDYWEEAGEKSTADMNKLEDGLNQLKDNEQAYLDGQDQLADAEVKLAEGEATLAKGEADYAAAPKKLAKGKADLAAGWSDYNAGKKQYDAGKKEYNAKKNEFEKIVDKFNELMDEGAGYPAWKKTYVAKLTEALTSGDDAKAACFSSAETYNTIVPSKVEEGFGTVAADGYTVVQALGNEQLTAAYASADPKTKIGILMTKVVPGLESKISLTQAAIDALDPEADETQKATLEGTIQQLNALKTKAETDINDMTFYATLSGLCDNRQKIYDELVPVLEKMASDEETAKKINALVSGGLSTIKQGLSNDGKMFIGTMDTLVPAAQDIIKENKAKLASAEKQLKDAEKQLAAGLKKLRKGERTYAQGLADYKAAPGKLADGRQQLADGYKQYEDGKNKLAEYENGEQQVRDGLATLFNTKADLDLESIADRLGGDGDFDNGDKHLDIDEGLNAVEVGRGYQADDGVLITKEIMGRAVATGGLIGAGVLAVLAAILSFLKKNKGAAVFALLAAAAGAFGAFYGPTQGTYFSEIAGSTIGTLTWVAAGVLGGVALVHAIAHFAAPKNV